MNSYRNEAVWGGTCVFMRIHASKLAFSWGLSGTSDLDRFKAT